MTIPAGDGPLLGAVEAGGTKFVLAVGTASGNVLASHRLPTTTPAETLAAAANWFGAQPPLAAIGIGSFGPAVLDPASPRYGHITDTPKPGWSDCDIAGHFARRFGVPIGFDTDVNGAALGEYLHGAGKAGQSLAYVTVGTGIGGGLVIGGEPVHGAAHPEMGHLFPRRPAGDTSFAGICPFHGDCLEGLASGPAIKARWGASLDQLPAGHEAHAIVADYLAQLCHTLFALTAVETIVLGGGVSQAPGLVERVRRRSAELSAGYLPGGKRHAVVAPGLGQNAGIVGALVLAARAIAQSA